MVAQPGGQPELGENKADKYRDEQASPVRRVMMAHRLADVPDELMRMAWPAGAGGVLVGASAGSYTSAGDVMKRK